MQLQKINSSSPASFKGKPIKGLKYIEKNLVKDFFDAEKHLCSVTLDKKSGKELLFVFGDGAKKFITEVHSKTKNILTRFLIDPADGNVGAIKKYSAKDNKKLSELKYLTFDGKAKFADEKIYSLHDDNSFPSKKVFYQVINGKDVKRLETGYFDIRNELINPDNAKVPLIFKCSKLYDENGNLLKGFSVESYETLKNRLMYKG